MTSSATPEHAAGGPREASSQVKTYRYLRVAMVMLLLGIGISVVLEFIANGSRCLQGSISAYYYTPVRAVFVSAVLALGVCLVALRGTTTAEEIALNCAGMLAPVVALVPTPGVGDCTSDRSLGQADAAAVTNNMHALFLVAPLCVGYLWALARVARRHGKVTFGPDARRVLVPVVVLWLAAYAVFQGWREAFLDHGHGVAAVLMFLAIVAVVALNATGLARTTRPEDSERVGVRAYTNRYSAIAAGMVAGFVGLPTVGLLTGWGHWVFAVEAVLLALFLVFWTLQTEELWDDAVREDDPLARPSAFTRPGGPR